MNYPQGSISNKLGWIASQNTKFALTLLVILILVLRISSPPTRVLTWDVFGHYLYLPAAFIHSDIGLEQREWIDEVFEKYEPSATFYQAYRLENNKWLIKYPLGVAFLMTPFFFIAHGLAWLSGSPMDGFSPVYQWTMAMGGLIYAFIGLWVLALTLRKFFDDRLTAILLALIVLGTNYLQLIAWDGTLLSHNFEFCLYAILLWSCIRWHESRMMKHALLTGLSFGLIVITRPSEMVVLLIPLLYGVFNAESFRIKWNLITRHKSHLVMAALVTLVIGALQMLYWHHLTGQWIYYSYVNPGEGFDFLRPHTIPFLFGFRKGWFIYTPLMILAIIGLWQVYLKARPLFVPLVVFLVLDVWLVSSWSCWWYAGGSFSSRAMLPAYVLLAIPLGYLLDRVRKHRGLAYLAGLILVIMVALNLFQTWQWKKGIISKDRMTREYYGKIFLKTSSNESARSYLLVERSVEKFDRINNLEGYTTRTLAEYVFDSSATPETDAEGSLYILDGEQPFSPGPDISFSALTSADHAWIQASATIFVTAGYECQSPVLVAAFHHKGKAYAYKAMPLDEKQLSEPGLYTLELDYLTPEVRHPDDNLKVYVWQPGTCKIYISNLKILVHEPVSRRHP